MSKVFKTELNDFDKQRLSNGFSVTLGSKRYHKCSLCGDIGVWTDEWEWYGSYRDLDDAVPVFKRCPKCPRPSIMPRGRKQKLEAQS